MYLPFKASGLMLNAVINSGRLSSRCSGRRAVYDSVNTPPPVGVPASLRVMPWDLLTTATLVKQANNYIHKFFNKELNKKTNAHGRIWFSQFCILILSLLPKKPKQESDAYDEQLRGTGNPVSI